MQRQETLQDLIEPVIQLNKALRGAAFRADHSAVATYLAQGADIAYALKGYAQSGNKVKLNRVLCVAKYILCCQFRRDRCGSVNDIENALSSASFTPPSDLDSVMVFSGICYPGDYYQRAAGLLIDDDGNDLALNTVDVHSICWSLFFSAVDGLLGSKTDTMVDDLFAARCFENPLLAMRFFSHINDAEQRLDFYAAAAAICRAQQLAYFFNYTDKNEFLACAALINQLLRSYQLSYELAHAVAYEPALIGWFQAMMQAGSFARLAPRDIGRIVADYVAGQDVAKQIDHQLDGYTPAASTVLSVGAWANHFSSLAGHLFGFHSASAVADAARPDVDESIRPWCGY